MSEQIDHAAEAQQNLVWSENLVLEGILPERAAHFQAAAQVHATLALEQAQRDANEQARIANVIALATSEHGVIWRVASRALFDNVAETNDIHPDIVAALRIGP